MHQEHNEIFYFLSEGSIYVQKNYWRKPLNLN